MVEVMVTFGEENYNFLLCCLKITLKRSTNPNYLNKNGAFHLRELSISE